MFYPEEQSWMDRSTFIFLDVSIYPLASLAATATGDPMFNPKKKIGCCEFRLQMNLSTTFNLFVQYTQFKIRLLDLRHVLRLHFVYGVNYGVLVWNSDTEK